MAHTHCLFPSHWLPTRSFGVIAAINRMALATGDVTRAIQGETADYNGHSVTVQFNDFRRYWVAEYQWGDRVVLDRGTLAQCLSAAKREYDRGALGAEVYVHTRHETEAAEAVAAGFQPCSEAIVAAHDATWRTSMHAEVGAAMELERQLAIPAVGFLATSKTLEEYQGKVDAFLAERRARNAR